MRGTALIKYSIFPSTSHSLPDPPVSIPAVCISQGETVQLSFILPSENTSFLQFKAADQPQTPEEHVWICIDVLQMFWEMFF